MTDPRIPPIPPEEAGERVRGIYEDIESLMFQVINSYRVWAHFPPGLDGTWRITSGFWREGGVDPKYRQLAVIATSKANGCHY